jgi:hypothetical protein
VTHPDRLATALWETQRHVSALRDALTDWKALAAPDWAKVEADRGLVRLLDQILFRFLKLQDAVGERLIPATLAVLAEPSEDWPMRDRLDRLERLGYLDVTQWLEWRAVRNRLAHEYPDAPELRWAALRAALVAAEALAGCVIAWHAKLQSGDCSPSPP